jgi:glycosyltransferase involved in cell wall biosynthesis
MRTLVVAREYPWPANSGSRLRLLTTLHGLCRLGPTDLFSITSSERTDFDEPDRSFGLENVDRVTVRSGGARFGGLARPLLPAALPLADRKRVSLALARFAAGTHDLAWFFDVRAWVLGGAPDLAPTVIDYDDLEHYKIRARLAVDTADGAAGPRAGLPGSPGVARWRRLPGRAFSQLESHRWARLYRTASSRVARTVVCSPLDAERATAGGVTNVAVVPNAYARPDRPVGRSAVGSPPVVLFHGTLRYPPNADAAAWLVGQIAPVLRNLVPDTHLRLVGLGNPGDKSFHEELSRADVVVVPLRFGSGTRVKIMEAFAHRIPVVSTTLGAEGLGVEGGQHLLLADTARGLASACARLLTEPELRRRLVDAAHELFLDAFEREVVESRIAAVAEAALDAGSVTRL